MTTIVDRGHEKDGSDFASRRRFRERFKKFAKKAVDNAISKGNVTDIGKGGVDVTVPKGDLKQPSIHHGPGGMNKHVIPGNRKYQVGHREPRGGGGGGGGGQGPGEGSSDDGEGNDDFTFHLSEEEFLNYMFEDLQLPNMEQKSQADLEQAKPKRAGHVSSGAFNKLDLPRSRQKKIGRTLAASKTFNEQILALLEEETSILSGYQPDSQEEEPVSSSEWQPSKTRIRLLEARLDLLRAFTDAATAKEQKRLYEINEEVAVLKKKMGLIPSWNESTDLRYRNHIPKPQPNSRAVMFCLMDASYSMDEERKSNAKIFYFLLYRFLKRQYERTDIVFIRYHSTAQEVDEKEFFYGTDTGGTVVHKSFELMKDILQKKYPEKDWNIYLAQASDGDNGGRDDDQSCKALLKELVKKIQASFYVEMPRGSTQQLWDTYKDLEKENPGKSFAGIVRERSDIWPLFRQFFSKTVKLDPGGGSALSYLSPK